MVVLDQETIDLFARTVRASSARPMTTAPPRSRRADGATSSSPTRSRAARFPPPGRAPCAQRGARRRCRGGDESGLGGMAGRPRRGRLRAPATATAGFRSRPRQRARRRRDRPARLADGQVITVVHGENGLRRGRIGECRRTHADRRDGSHARVVACAAPLGPGSSRCVTSLLRRVEPRAVARSRTSSSASDRRCSTSPPSMREHVCSSVNRSALPGGQASPRRCPRGGARRRGRGRGVGTATPCSPRRSRSVAGRVPGRGRELPPGDEAIGFTLEHDLHRFILRGTVLDVLYGSARELRLELGQALTKAAAPRPGVL